jgi:hypothetical protein
LHIAVAKGQFHHSCRDGRFDRFPAAEDLVHPAPLLGLIGMAAIEHHAIAPLERRR